MREPEYLSPTSLSLFYNDRREFYLKYICDNPPPRIPQTQPMSIGAAFDAYIKSYLVENLFGEKRPQFEFDTIFTNQVEPHNRDWARENGQYVFDEYKSSGALADLMIELSHATHEPRFEFTVTDQVAIRDGVIPLYGKPDIYFVVKSGDHVILDWKVNGYCSRGTTSPKKGYVKIRPGDKMHKDCQTMHIDGIDVNIAMYLEDVDESWARQLAIYAWILGEEVGAKFITGIDQIVAKGGAERPVLRVATHRCRISADYQRKLENEIHDAWEAIRTGQYFEENNEETCKQLDLTYLAFKDDGSDKEAWYREIMGR